MSEPQPDFDLWSGLNRRVRTERLAVTLCVLLATALLAYFSQFTGVQEVDHLLYDKALQITSRPVTNENIVIVAIDDDSIQQLGHWPWRRQTHALLLERLSQARVVGFDVLFNDSNPAYPLDDALLAAAIAQHGRVALPTIIRDGLDGTETLITPLPELAKAAAGMGYINATVDMDGAIRSVILRRELQSGQMTDHFVYTLLGMANHARPDLDPFDFAPKPPVPERHYLIPYAGQVGHFPLYPYAAVLSGDIPPEEFQNRLVLVGNWSSGLTDVFPTPLSNQGVLMPGVEILANALNALTNSHWIRSTTPWQTALLSCLPVLLTSLTFRRRSPRQSLALTVAILVLVLLSSLALLQFFGLWFPPTASIIGIIVALPVWNWRSQEAALKHIDEQLGLLRQDISPSIRDNSSQADGQDRSLPARITELNQAISQFRKAERHRQDTLRFLSHDMRAPQNAILALLDMREQNPDSLETAALLQRVRQHAATTLGLTDGFVQMAKAEIGPMSQHDIDLADLMQECCDSFWELAQSKNISLEDDIPAEHAWVTGDRNLLGRAIRNLIDNALKYSPADSLVGCSLVRDGDDWLIAVQDQGRGLTPQQVETLFTPFHRFDDSLPDNPGGVGLGLSFVQIVVERHGGEISVQSQAGEGSTFTVRLQAAADHEASTTTG